MTHPLGRRSFLAMAAGAAGTTLATDKATGQRQVRDSQCQGTLDFSRRLPLSAPYDVVFCGGGPSGVSAALAARRCGLKVLLVEAMGQLGGVGVSGLVSHWLGGRSRDCREWVVGGLFRSLVEEAARRGFVRLPQLPPAEKYTPHGWLAGLAHGVPFDPFAMAHYLDERMTQSGVDPLLLTQAVEVLCDGRRITHVVIFNKSGLTAVPTKAVIDATGDADLAARSGCKVVKGREEDQLMTPATLAMHVEQVDQDALAEYIRAHKAPRFREEIARLRQAGQWPFPYDIFISVQLDEPGTMFINTSRMVGIDGTDGASMTDAMIRGRREAYQLLDVMRKHFPGFARARIKVIAPVVGIRETRRLCGRFILAVKDLVAGAAFEDTIGFSSYGWDLPDPKRPSHNPSHGKMRSKTPIPYRVMLPQPIENLICPGRAISVERPVLGPLRVMAPCMAMGEAAGHAAAQVVKRSIPFEQVDIAALRRDLQEQGAIL